MRATDGFVKALEDEATEQLQSIRAYRVYQGSDPEYKQRAKLAIGVVGAYVRLRATIANERTNDLVALRLLGPHGDGDGVPALAPAPESPRGPKSTKPTGGVALSG